MRYRVGVSKVVEEVVEVEAAGVDEARWAAHQTVQQKLVEQPLSGEFKRYLPMSHWDVEQLQ